MAVNPVFISYWNSMLGASVVQPKELC